MRFSVSAFFVSAFLLSSFVFAQGLNQGMDPNPTSVQIGIPDGPAAAEVDPDKRIDSGQERKMSRDKRVVNRIAATVNGRPITANEVAFRLMPIGAQLATLYPRRGMEFHKQLTKAKKEIIEDLIERELVLSDFESKGFAMPDSAIDQEVNRTIIENFNGNRDRFLASLKESGLTIRGFRESSKKHITVMAMRAQKYDQEIPPTPDEINREYNKSKAEFRDLTKDRVKFKKIFIPLFGDEDSTRTPDVQLELAELIANEIRSGKAKFEDMAKQYSKDTMAAEGGDWPMKERSEFSPEFATIIFDAKEGQVVGPLIDPYGFTIVVVQNKQFAPAPPLSEIKEQIDTQVRSKRSLERYKQWIDRLRSKAIINVYI